MVSSGLIVVPRRNVFGLQVCTIYSKPEPQANAFHAPSHQTTSNKASFWGPGIGAMKLFPVHLVFNNQGSKLIKQSNSNISKNNPKLVSVVVLCSFF